MAQEPLRSNRPVSDHLHVYVRRSILALAVWLIATVVALFSAHGHTALAVAVVCAFIFIVVVLACALLHIGVRGERVRGISSTGDSVSLRDWLSGQFRIYQGSLSGKDAAIEIILPLAAVSLGMTLFGIILHFAAPGAA